jgi:hypothetical protein
VGKDLDLGSREPFAESIILTLSKTMKIPVSMGGIAAGIRTDFLYNACGYRYTKLLGVLGIKSKIIRLMSGI